MLHGAYTRISAQHGIVTYYKAWAVNRLGARLCGRSLPAAIITNSKAGRLVTQAPGLPVYSFRACFLVPKGKTMSRRDARGDPREARDFSQDRPPMEHVVISVSAQVMSGVRTVRVGQSRIANPVHIEIEFSAQYSNLRRQRVGKVFKADRQGLR